jgi:signal transduction histidine kinase
VEKIKTPNQSSMIIYNVLKGGLIGYFIIHPFMMFVTEVMHRYHEEGILHIHALEEGVSAILMSFKIPMLPWAFTFTLFGMAIGYYYGIIQLQLEKQKTKLEQSNRLKEIFADIMGHDLVNSIGIIKNFGELLSDEEDGPTIKEGINTMTRNANKALEMIEYTSHLARIEDTKEIVFEKRDLGSILGEVVEGVQSHAIEKEVDIQLTTKGEYPAKAAKFADALFLNLLTNAIKYGPRKGKVIVGIEDKGRNWRVFVKDNGEGIDDKYKKSIFTRFERLKREGVKGTGLGLAIVKRLVEIHNWRVWVEDNPEGGSIFYVEISKSI